MSSEVATNASDNEYVIEVNGLGKCYQIYDKPSDRLKQMLIRGRKRYYKEFWALKDVSFKIKKGETVGIIGRNGSGKSTLLQLICGTLSPTTGEVKVNGRVAALLELGAGFNPEFSGVENVYMAASLYGLSKEEVDLRFQAIAAFADIGDHIHQPVKTYSSGMYVRLAFAVIAHVDADLLIIDEALAVGDVYFTQKCIRFLNEFKEANTLVFVSHDSASVQALCDKAILLERGSVAKYGGVIEVLEKYHSSLLPTEDFEVESLLTEKKSDKDVNLLSGFNASRNRVGSSAHILSLALTTVDGEIVNVVEVGVQVVIDMEVLVNKEINGLLLGYTFKDRLGQVLFEDNISEKTKNNNIRVGEGNVVKAQFAFEMPLLKTGEYTIDVAVAEGTQKSHINHQWIYEGLVIQCYSAKEIYGLFDLRRKSVEIRVL